MEKIFNRLNFGTTLRYVTSKIDNAKANVITFDIGFIFVISSINSLVSNNSLVSPHSLVGRSGGMGQLILSAIN